MDLWSFNQDFQEWINLNCYGEKRRPEDYERPRIALSAEDVYRFGLIGNGVPVYFAAYHVNAEIPHYIPIRGITRRSITGTPYVRYLLEHDHERTLDHDNSVNAETKLYILINTAQEYIIYSVLKSLIRAGEIKEGIVY